MILKHVALTSELACLPAYLLASDLRRPRTADYNSVESLRPYRCFLTVSTCACVRRLVSLVLLLL